jgi:hypothetical protein
MPHETLGKLSILTIYRDPIVPSNVTHTDASRNFREIEYLDYVALVVLHYFWLLVFATIITNYNTKCQ